MNNKPSIFKKLFVNYSIIIIVSFLIFITLFVFLLHNSLYNLSIIEYYQQCTVLQCL